MGAPLPISIVTGFLGSGKTTLLRRALERPSMRETAVLVNEFGEVGLDHHLLRRVDEKTVLLGSGCVCCTRREDLVEALLELLDHDARPDRVVVETTGLADPAPILHTVFSDPVLQHHFRVDLVLTTVDAINGAMHLRNNPESVRQVAAADRLVVTKTDLAGPEEVGSLISRLAAMNPSAPIHDARTGGGDLLAPAGPRVAPDGPPGGASHDTGDTHSVSLTFDGPVDWTAFGIWLSMLLHARGEEVLRVKGMLDTGGAGPVVVNGVQHTIHPPQHLPAWPDGDHASRIIFITRGIPSERVRASLDAFAGLLGARPVPL